MSNNQKISWVSFDQSDGKVTQCRLFLLLLKKKKTTLILEDEEEGYK